MLNSFLNRSLALLLLAMIFPGFGCTNSNQLRGRVVDAGFTQARFVSETSPDVDRNSRSGISGAKIELVRDPRSLGREVVARATSDHEGRFSMDIDAFGAGWMNEEWLFRCTHPGFPMVELFDSLPSLDSPVVLLIDMGVGSGLYQTEVIDEQERIRREIERYGR